MIPAARSQPQPHGGGPVGSRWPRAAGARGAPAGALKEAQLTRGEGSAEGRRTPGPDAVARASGCRWPAVKVEPWDSWSVRLLTLSRASPTCPPRVGMRVIPPERPRSPAQRFSPWSVPEQHLGASRTPRVQTAELQPLHWGLALASRSPPRGSKVQPGWRPLGETPHFPGSLWPESQPRGRRANDCPDVSSEGTTQPTQFPARAVKTQGGRG